MRKILRSSAIVLFAAAALLTGCQDDTPTFTVDSSLTGLLVTGSNLPSGWHVEDMSNKLAESSGKKDSAKPDPADCDSSDKTSLASGVGARVSGKQNVPGVVVTLMRSPGTQLVAETEDWLAKCHSFSATKDDVTANVTVQRIEPPAGEADAQVGFDMESKARAGGESVTVSVKGYTAQVGDIVVMCIAMGGSASGGKTLVPDVDMLNTVFAAQVTKVRNASASPVTG